MTGRTTKPLEGGDRPIRSNYRAAGLRRHGDLPGRRSSPPYSLLAMGGYQLGLTVTSQPLTNTARPNAWRELVAGWRVTGMARTSSPRSRMLQCLRYQKPVIFTELGV